MPSEIDELSSRVWSLIRKFGEEYTEGGTLYYHTDTVSIELAYNARGMEFLDVNVPSRFGGRRVYRELDGKRSHDEMNPSLQLVLEHLRQHMVLDDLAGA